MGLIGLSATGIISLTSPAGEKLVGGRVKGPALERVGDGASYTWRRSGGSTLGSLTDSVSFCSF